MFKNVIADEKVTNLVEDFLLYLTSEKRCSNHTIVSYQNDIFYFLSFLKDQSQNLVNQERLESLTIADFRSWLVFRKNKGFSNSSTSRAVSCLHVRA